MAQPRYIQTHARGGLERRAGELSARLAACDLCPRRCGADRTSADPAHWGRCGVGALPKVSSFGPHFGEEEPLVGTGGSGTIFLTGCNLGCRFCQNHDISLQGRGETVSVADLAAMMLDLKARGCHNINFVTPSHQVPAIVTALVMAVEAGLDIPLVYNSGGYDSPDTLAALDGVIDIYMPDLKFVRSDTSARLCDAPDYFAAAGRAVSEMHRQVGDLVMDEEGRAVRGLLVRHLVLPNGLADTRAVVRFVAGLSRRTYLNIMAQYRPCAEAHSLHGLERATTPDEHARAVTEAALAGLTRLDKPRLGRLLKDFI